MKRGDLQEKAWIDLNLQKLDALLAPGKAVLLFATGHKDNKPGVGFHASQLGAQDHVAVAWRDEAGNIQFREVTQGPDDTLTGYGKTTGLPTLGSESTSGTANGFFADYASVDVVPLNLPPDEAKIFINSVANVPPGKGGTYSFGQNGEICTTFIFKALLEIPAFKEAFDGETGTFSLAKWASDTGVKLTGPLADTTLHIVRPDDLFSFAIYLLAQSYSFEASTDTGEVVFHLPGYDLRLGASDVRDAIWVWAQEEPKLELVLQVAKEAYSGMADREHEDYRKQPATSTVINPDEALRAEARVQPDNPDPEESAGMAYREGVPSHPRWGDTWDPEEALRAEARVQPDNPDLPDTDSPNSFINVAHRAFEISPEMTRDALRAEDARTDGASQKPTTDDDQKASEEQVALASDTEHARVDNPDQQPATDDDEEASPEQVALTADTEHARIDNPDQQPATDDDEEASPEQVALTSDTEHARVDNPDQQPATDGIYKTGPSGITVRMAERPEDIDSDSPNPATDGNQKTSPLQDHDNAGESAGIPDNPDEGFSYAAFLKPGVPVEAGKEAMPVEQPSPEGNSSSETPQSESAHPDIGSEDVGNAAPTKEPVVHHGDLAP